MRPERLEDTPSPQEEANPELTEAELAELEKEIYDLAFHIEIWAEPIVRDDEKRLQRNKDYVDRRCQELEELKAKLPNQPTPSEKTPEA